MSESLKPREGEAAAARPATFEPPSLRRLIRANKRVAAAVGGILAVLIAIVVITDVASPVSRVSDSTPCSGWSSATPAQRNTYAARYVREHGPLPGGASDAATIERAIDNGCNQAYSFDEADGITVLQAIRGQY